MQSDLRGGFLNEQFSSPKSVAKQIKPKTLEKSEEVTFKLKQVEFDIFGQPLEFPVEKSAEKKREMAKTKEEEYSSDEEGDEDKENLKPAEYDNIFTPMKTRSRFRRPEGSRSPFLDITPPHFRSGRNSSHTKPRITQFSNHTARKASPGSIKKLRTMR